MLGLPFSGVAPRDHLSFRIPMWFVSCFQRTDSIPRCCRVGDLKVERKQQVPLPRAVGDYDAVYELKWIQPPRVWPWRNGKLSFAFGGCSVSRVSRPAKPDRNLVQAPQHLDVEYKPELRTKKLVPPPQSPKVRRQARVSYSLAAHRSPVLRALQAPSTS